MEDEVIIDDTNILDRKDQDLEGLEALLQCDELNIDTTPESISHPQKEMKINYKICRCGNIIYKNHKSEFRCGQCGCIIYNNGGK